MPDRHAVVIVGGGPAGSSAAYTLARSGIDVCVIDKCAFPRPKLCGGLLTQRARKSFVEIFESEWAPMFDHTSHGARFYDRNRLINRIERYGELYFCNRYRFDAKLLDMAGNEGADLILRDKVVAVDTVSKRCQLASGKEIGYRYLIGADGVNGIVARAIFGKPFDRDRHAFALEATVPVPRCMPDRGGDVPEIYFNIVDWGYGWIFPKGDALSVGVGGAVAKTDDFGRHFRRFYADRFNEEYAGTLRGHYIPLSGGVRGCGAGEVLLAGDAAGLVDPVTGEGIAHAMQSGFHAAQAISAGLSGRNGNVLQEYRKRYSPIVEELSYATRLSFWLFSKYTRRLIINELAHSASMPGIYMDLMSGDLSYQVFYRIVRQKIIRKMMRGWR